MRKDVYQVVTDRIIRLLEAGTVPWRKPWKGGLEAPRNFVSRKAYRGINVFVLHAAGYASPFWLTFAQVKSLNGCVKKGEHSWPVVFWKILEDQENGETKKIPFLRYHSVFNVAQCDGITVPASRKIEVTFTPIEKCEQIVIGMPKAPPIEHGGDCACYHPREDKVRMPQTASFESPERYYHTLFHELTHATGHVSRLNRKEITGPIEFGSDPYSREELVAEMGAAFLSGNCQIESVTIEHSASYIQNWLERLKDDRKLVVQAAALAQRAADFILNVPAEENLPSETQPKEFKVVALRECPTPEHLHLCECPEGAVEYWRTHVTSHPYFNPECECFVVLLLNTRRRIKGHQLVSTGTLDTILVHPREVFRAAVVSASASIVIMHNHPSGDPTPSEADIKVTRELTRAGQLLKIEVCDHVIIGNPRHTSLRAHGYFNS